ncbi:hypothetical protein ACIA8K_31025 [Catenuloplanes sp. NPDC051500]|uniref:hypothetical protein n=1 Tax=Catenuloplanes sp. NPDC051500 TaxID=3363959 RepID=UPI0037A7AE27
MPTQSMLDIICRDGMFLPVPGGVYFHPGQTRASVDLMALMRAMGAPRPATGGAIFVPGAALSSGSAMQALGRTLSTLDRPHDVVIAPVPGDPLDPRIWLDAAETAGAQAYLPPLPGTGPSARLVPVGPDDRETAGTPIAVRILPPGDATARDLLRTAARLADDHTRTPLARVRELGASTSAAYPLAVGMVLEGAAGDWDPGRLTPPTADEVWNRFGGGVPVPDGDLTGALLATPGSRALVRTSGLGGDRLTWLIPDGGTVWATGPDLAPVNPRLLAQAGAVAFHPAIAPGPAAPALPEFLISDLTVVPSITVTEPGNDGPRPVGLVRTLMDRGASSDGLIGVDYFGAVRPARTPSYARNPGTVPTTALRDYFDRLDRARNAGAPALADLGLADLAESDDGVWRNAAGQEMPLHIPNVWFGELDPADESVGKFLDGVANQTRAMSPHGFVSTLWVNRQPSPAALSWARDNGVRLIRAQDVYHEGNPLDPEVTLGLAAHTPEGAATSVDVFRWRLVHDFGGLYLDGDARIPDPAATVAELRRRFDENGWALQESPPGEDGARAFNNAAIMSARHHPAPGFFRQRIKDNYRRPQRELMSSLWDGFAGADGGRELAGSPEVDVWRRPTLWLANPEFSGPEDADLPPALLAPDGNLPGLLSIAYGLDGTWISRDPLTPRRTWADAARDEILRDLAARLVWALGFRDGDLHLTEVASVVAGLRDPASAWRELLEPFLTEPALRDRIRTVTDRTMIGDANGEVRVGVVPLPADLRVALGLGPEPDRGQPAGGWRLGELMRPAQLAETPVLRWTGVQGPGSVRDATEVTAGHTTPALARAAAGLVLLTAALDARLGPLFADGRNPAVAAIWSRFRDAARARITHAPDIWLRNLAGQYHSTRERIYDQLRLDPGNVLLPPAVTVMSRLFGDGPQVPDPDDPAQAVALSTVAPWMSGVLLRDALSGLPPWDAQAPDCVDRVMSVLSDLEIPLAGSATGGLLGRDALAERLGGRFLAPVDALRLDALRIGAITPVWAIHRTDPAHMVLVHRLDKTRFTLVETQETGDDRLQPFTLADRGGLPRPLTGMIRLLGDADEALTQVDLRTRATVAGRPGSAAPASDRTVEALVDRGVGRSEPGMAGGSAQQPGVVFEDDSAEDLYQLARRLGEVGTRFQQTFTSRAQRHRELAVSLIRRVVRVENLVHRDLVDPQAGLYRTRLNSVEITVRAEVNAQGDPVRVLKPLPLDTYLHDEGLDWLATDLMSTGWRVTHDTSDEIRAGTRQIRTDTLRPARRTERTFREAYAAQLGLERRDDHLIYQVARPHLHEQARQLVARHDRDLRGPDPARRRRAWSVVADTLADEAGIPRFTRVVLDDSGAPAAGFDLRTWSLTLDGRHSVDQLMTALLRGLLHNERSSVAIRDMLVANALTGQAQNVPAAVLDLLSRYPHVPDTARVAAHEWTAGSDGARQGRRSLDELGRHLMSPRWAAPGSRLHRRLLRESSTWRRLTSELGLRYARMPRLVSDLAVERGFQTAGSVLDWSGVAPPVPDGFAAHPLAEAGFLLHDVDYAPVAITRRPPATGPLVVIQHHALADIGHTLRALRSTLPVGAVVELLPSARLQPETLIGLAADLGPDHMLTIGKDLVELPWGYDEIRHFASYGVNHRPALGPFASYYRVGAAPFDPNVVPTAPADVKTGQYTLGDGVRAAMINGRLWLGEAGTVPVIQPGDPQVVVGTPVAGTPWHVWQIAVDRVALWSAAAGKPFELEKVRVHRPQPQPATLPDVSEGVVLGASEQDQQLFRWMFGGPESVDPARLRIVGRTGVITAYHLVDRLADIAGVPPGETDQRRITWPISQTTQLITGGDDMDSLRRVLALSYVAARTGGVGAIDFDRLATLHLELSARRWDELIGNAPAPAVTSEPRDTLSPAHVDSLTQLGLGWLADDLRSAGWRPPPGTVDERAVLAVRDGMLGLDRRHDSQQYRVGDPGLHQRARDRAAADNHRLSGVDPGAAQEAWTALAGELAHAAGLPLLEPVLLGANGGFDSGSWTVTLDPNDGVDGMLDTLLRGLLQAEQHIVRGWDRLRHGEIEAADVAEQNIPRVQAVILRHPDVDDARTQLLRQAWSPESRNRARELRQAGRSLDGLRPAPVPSGAGERVRHRLAAAHDAWRSERARLDVLAQLGPRTAAELWVTRSLRTAGSARDWSGASLVAPLGFRVTGLGNAGLHVHRDGARSSIERRPAESGPLVVIDVRPGMDLRPLSRSLDGLPPGTLVELNPDTRLTAGQAVELARELGTAHVVTIRKERVAPPDADLAGHFASYGRNHRPALGPFAAYHRVGAAPFDPADELTTPRDGAYRLGAGTIAYQVGKHLWIGEQGAEPVIAPGDPEVVVGSPGRTTPWIVWQTALSRIAEFSAAAGLALRTRRIRVHEPELAPDPVPEVADGVIHRISGADRWLFETLFGTDTDPGQLAMPGPGGQVTAYLLADTLLDLAGVPLSVVDGATITAAVDALALRVTGGEGVGARLTLLTLAADAARDGGLEGLTTMWAPAALQTPVVTGPTDVPGPDVQERLFAWMSGTPDLDTVEETAPGREFTASHLMDALAVAAGVPSGTTDEATVQAALSALTERVAGSRGPRAHARVLAVAYLAALADGPTAVTEDRLRALYTPLAAARPEDLFLIGGREWAAAQLDQRSAGDTLVPPDQAELGQWLLQSYGIVPPGQLTAGLADLRIYRAEVDVPITPAEALARPGLPSVLDDARFAMRMAQPGVDELTRADEPVRQAWASVAAALDELGTLPEQDGWARLGGLGAGDVIRQVARLVPDGGHPVARPLLALDAVLRTGVFPDNEWPAPMPVLKLGTWTAQPPAILRSVDAYATHAGRPVIAVDLSGAPEVVTPVIAALRDAIGWYRRIGPAPLVIGSRATAFGAARFEEVRTEQRPVALTIETAGFEDVWRLRDTDGRTVGDLEKSLTPAVLRAAAALSPAPGTMPVALAEWLRARDPQPAEAYHRRNRERLHDPRVAEALTRLAASAPDDARLAAFRTALEVAMRAGLVGDARPRPVVSGPLGVEPAWTAERGPVPVTFVYDYVSVGGSRAERYKWDGLLVQLLLAGELTGEQALSLARATAVTSSDLANVAVLEALAELRDLPADRLDGDPYTTPHLLAIVNKVGKVSRGDHGSYADCLDPIDRTAWVGRLDGYRAGLLAAGDEASALRARLIEVVTYVLSNC